MLKFLFCCLLVLNLLLFALGRGWLGSLGGEVHEAARLKNQLNADKISLISATRANAAATDSATAAAAAPGGAASTAARDTIVACTEVGNFAAADARRFETQLEALQLGDRQSRHNAVGQDISSYIVLIPPQGSKDNADKKAAELKQLGVSNFFIISDASPLRWAISLGVFKTEAAAQSQLAVLVKQGVHSARVNPRYSPSKEFAYQFRDLDGATRQRLGQIKAGFPDQDMHSCK